jgi:zinc protease
MEPIDRSRPPAAGPPRPFRFPRFERHRLENGCTVVAAPLRRVPLAVLEVVAPAGAHLDPPGRSGLAGLVGSLLDEGTAGKTAPEIAAAIEALGGTLSTGAGWDGAWIAVEIESRHLKAALELTAEILRGASFPPAEVERIRKERLAEVLRRKRQPGTQAELHLRREIYGPEVSYGTTVLGSEESLSAIARQEIVDFHRRHHPPAAATVVAVGDFDVDRLLAATGAALGHDGAPPSPIAPTFSPPPHRGRRVVIQDRPEAPQIELRVGQAGLPRRHPDYLALRVVSILLGGKFTSRLNLNLRERLGLTYGASSALYARTGPGPLVISTSVSPGDAGRATAEILLEVERLRQEPPAPEELADTIAYLLGTFPFSLQTYQGVVSRLEDLVVFDLPDDTYDRRAENLLALDAEDLLRVARAYLDPDRMMVAASGPAAILRPALEPFGPVAIVSAI